MEELSKKIMLPGACAQPFDIDYDPALLHGSELPNSVSFTVHHGVETLAVFATCSRAPASEANSVGVVLTDPNGNRFSTGIALPMLEAPRREIVVEKPLPGRWLLQVCATGLSYAAAGARCARSSDGEASRVTGVIITQSPASQVTS